MAKSRLKRKLIADSNRLRTVRNDMRTLHNDADRCFRMVDNECSTIRGIVATIPQSARDSSLTGALNQQSSSSIATSRVPNALTHIISETRRLEGELAENSTRWVEQVRNLRSDSSLMSSQARATRGQIGTGAVNLNSRDFIANFTNFLDANERYRVQLLVNLTERFHELEGIRNSVSYSIDPVNLATGNFIYLKDDLETGGTLSLRWGRFYNAIDTRSGFFGRNWRHSFELELFQDENGDMCIIFDDGHLEKYSYTEEGFVSPAGTDNAFEAREDVFILSTKEGLSYTFDNFGTLISISDTNENVTELSYCNEGRLAKIENACSALHVKNNDLGQILEVEDHTGRKVKYRYVNRLLTSMTDAEGNTHSYEYDRSERLIKVTNAEGELLLTNTYNSDFQTTRQDFFDNGVMSYEYCKDTNTTVLTEQNKNKIIYGHDERLRNTSIEYTDGKKITTFDDRDKHTSETDKLGNTTYYSYDERGNLSEIKDPLEGVTKIIYGEHDKPTSVTSPNGGVAHFEYDKGGNLIRFIDEVGRITEAKVNSFGVPTKIILPDKSITKIICDNKGNVIEVISPNGGKIKYEYNELGQVIKTTNQLGHSTHFEYNLRGDLICITNAAGQKRHIEYNKNGKVTLVRDFCGAISRFTYNPFGKVTSVTDGQGNVTEYIYDQMWNVEKVILPTKEEIHYSYNKLNQLTKITDPNGGEIHLKYNASGKVIEQTDQLGNSTYFTYDELNRLSSQTDASGNTNHFEYDAVGNLIKLTDALGNIRTFEYNLASELIKTTNSLGATTERTYCPLGNLATQTDALGNVTSLSYYSGGKLKEVVDALGNITHFEYDLAERLCKITDKAGQVIKIEYDCLDRPISFTAPDSTSSTLVYNGQGKISKVIDADGNVTKCSHDSLGNLKSVTDALGYVTKYSYNALSHLTSITRFTDLEQINSQVTQFERNWQGLITREVDPLGQKVDYSYDLAGNMTSRIDKCGGTTNFTYDALHQLTQVAYPDSCAVAFAYNELRQLKEVQDHLGKISIETNALGELASATNHRGEKVSYTYNELGQRTSITYPDGSVANYSLDALGRTEKAVDSLGNETKYSYDPVGKLLERVLPNGVKSIYSYTNAGRISELINLSNDETLDKLNYSYNKLGNITEIIKERAGADADSGTFSYGYDALSRLTEVTSPQGAQRYSYDGLGNRIAAEIDGEITNYSYNALNQLILKQSPNMSKAFEYDSRGNLVKTLIDGALDSQYHFSAAGMLEKAITPKGVSEHSYTGLNKRISSTFELIGNPAQTTDYLLDFTKPYHDLLATTQDGKSQNFMWSAGDVISATSGSLTNYYLNDHLASPMRLLGYDGATAQPLAFDEFGVPILDSDADTALTNPFGFTGYQQDPVSELYFAQARYYSPEMSRFISSDIVKHGNNYYAYASANPLNLVDRNGLFDDYVHIGVREANGEFLPAQPPSQAPNAINGTGNIVNSLYDFGRIAPPEANLAYTIANHNKNIDWPQINVALPSGSSTEINTRYLISDWNPSQAVQSQESDRSWWQTVLVGPLQIDSNIAIPVPGLNSVPHHFNRNTDGTDSRQDIASTNLAGAIDAFNRGDYDGAWLLLGQGLHALQDIDAHGNVGMGNWIAAHGPNFDNAEFDWEDATMTSVRPSNTVTLACGTEVLAMLRYRRTQLTTMLYLNHFLDGTVRNCAI